MTGQLTSVGIAGIAFWHSRLPGWAVAKRVLRGEGEAPPPAMRPAPVLLAPTERRRAPDTVAIALEVASKACEAANCSPAGIASVFASTHGDLAISDYMCATLVNTPTLISPVKFHNSVHNAAAGYWSIGTGNYAPYTALSAYEYTFAVGLLETVTQVLCEQKPVLYVAFDIEAKGALATVAPSRGLFGVALVIVPQEAANATTRMKLSVRKADLPIPASDSAAAAVVADNALAPCIPFFDALATGKSAVRLKLSPSQTLDVSFE
ncbi:MAG: beta-ketoacyl synthase chain length factor [Povalibacter sp.]